ncbi:MAG: hypothetical protein ACI80V_000391 [Rhodothermales bacterium]
MAVGNYIWRTKPTPDMTFRASLRLIASLSLAAVLLGTEPALAQTRSIPTPESVFGFEVGADFQLINYEQSLAYFQLLDAASDRLTLVETGRTSEGRPWFFALVSTADNLRNLDRSREIVDRLAHPAGLSNAEARLLASEGKTFVHIDGGLHATEVAGAQHTIQLAYDLVSGTGQLSDDVLDDVIVLLWPSLNPDGQTMVSDWYMANVGTPYEVAPLPALYQKYIGHDNNRDSYALNMIESRVVARTWRDWEPHIKYVHHQTAPFPTRIWLPPFADPIAAQSPPLIAREVNMMGMAIAQMLESNGQPGATHMGTGFDAWYPGYVDYMPVLQNVAAFFTETALYRYATPHFYTVNDFPRDKRGLRAETLYPSPWKGGWWRLGDAVDYMVTASSAVIDYASKYRETILYNRYQSGRDTIERYAEGPPYAYFISQNQRDPVAPVEMLRRLAFSGIRISQLTEQATVGGNTFQAGTWVIPMDQEFAELARQVLDVQTYPDLRQFPEGPQDQPYDAAGWTLSYQFGVRVVAATEPLTAAVRGAMKPVSAETTPWSEGVTSVAAGDGSGPTEAEPDAATFDSVPGVGFNTNAVAAGILPPDGQLTGSGSSYLIDPAANNAFRAVNAALQSGARVSFAKEGGRYVIQGASDSQASRWSNDFALDIERTRSVDSVPIRSRVGMYRPWNASMDEGWTRWLLELYGFEFANITSGQMRAGNLEDRYDVILLASDSPRSLVDGYAKGSVPARFEGGLGTLGVRALDRFVRGGGTLVCLNASSDFAIDQLHLPVRNVVADLASTDFFTGGSILEVQTDPTHPVMAGMPSSADVFVWRSPVFTAKEGFEGTALAKYAAKGSPLRSGYLLGEEHLNAYAAAMDVKHGDGHVILLGFRPQWRGQSFGTFRVLFNSVFYGSQLASSGLGDADFWTPPAAPEENDDPEKSN